MCHHTWSVPVLLSKLFLPQVLFVDSNVYFFFFPVKRETLGRFKTHKLKISEGSRKVTNPNLKVDYFCTSSIYKNSHAASFYKLSICYLLCCWYN